MQRSSMRGVLLVLGAGFLGGVVFVVACGTGPDDVEAHDAGQGGGAEDCQCTVSGPIAVEQPVTVIGEVSVSDAVTVTGIVELDNQPVSVIVSGQPIDVNAAIDPNVPLRVIHGADFKGVTSTPRAGTAGWGTFNADCDAAFPGSRTCTDDEILNTFPGPVPGSDSWVLWTTRAAYDDGNPHMFNAFGVAVATDTMNCSDHNSPSPFSVGGGEGFLLTTQGNFAKSDCQNMHVVACCGL
jgi:hypothetical protein